MFSKFEGNLDGTRQTHTNSWRTCNVWQEGKSNNRVGVGCGWVDMTVGIQEAYGV